MKSIVTAVYYILTGQIVESWFVIELIRNKVDEMRRRVETLVERM